MRPLDAQTEIGPLALDPHLGGGGQPMDEVLLARAQLSPRPDRVRAVEEQGAGDESRVRTVAHAGLLGERRGGPQGCARAAGRACLLDRAAGSGGPGDARRIDPREL